LSPLQLHGQAGVLILRLVLKERRRGTRSHRGKIILRELLRYQLQHLRNIASPVCVVSRDHAGAMPIRLPHWYLLTVL
jgi:hypothetical protein